MWNNVSFFLQQFWCESCKFGHYYLSSIYVLRYSVPRPNIKRLFSKIIMFWIISSVLSEKWFHPLKLIHVQLENFGFFSSHCLQQEYIVSSDSFLCYCKLAFHGKWLFNHFKRCWCCFHYVYDQRSSSGDELYFSFIKLR